MDIIKTAFASLSALSLGVILQLALTVVLALIAIKYVGKLMARALEKSTLDPSVKSLAVSVMRGLLYFVLVLILAQQLNIPVTSLVTLLGAFGLAVSLALQNSLANLAGGIFILVTKPFVTGDYIEVTDGASGTVDSIGFIYTVVKTVDNRRIYLPNGSISSDKITNYSAEENRRLEMTFPVPYECDAAAARTLIEETLMQDGRIMRDPAPYVRVWTLGASAVDILCRVWVKNAEYFEVRSDALVRVKAALEQNGISIPYNQLDVRVRARQDGKE